MHINRFLIKLAFLLLLTLVAISTVRAAQEVRFVNKSTIPNSNVSIMPIIGYLPNGNPGSTDLYWTNPTTMQKVVWSANAYQNFSLTNLQSGFETNGVKYYKAYVNSFTAGKWYIGLGGTNYAPTNVPMGPNGIVTAPSPTASGGTWGAISWQPFEYILDGNAADQIDTTEINNYAIPLTIVTYTNANDGIWNYYEVTGFTNYVSNNQALLANLANTYPNAVVYNSSGVPINFIPPASINYGSLALPPPYTGPNIYIPFTEYFTSVGTNQTMIKDSISVINSGGTNWAYDYDFILTVSGVNHNLGLTGKMTARTTVAPLITNTYNNLKIFVGGDDPQNNNYWASSFVYLQPTPPNANPNSVPGSPFSLAGTFSSWENIAIKTGQWKSDANPWNATNTTSFINSVFSTSVIGKIMGDAAAGFAFGCVNSPAINPAYTKLMGKKYTYGNSPSGSWWGGNEYPTCKTNTQIFDQLQTNPAFYVQYAGKIFSNTMATYAFSIEDRYSDRFPIAIICATNTSANFSGINKIEITIQDAGFGNLPKKLNPNLIVPGIPNQVYYPTPPNNPTNKITLPSATSLNTNSVSYTISGAATLTNTGTTLFATLTNYGLVTLNAYQPQDSKYYAGSAISSFTSVRANPITFPVISNKIYHTNGMSNTFTFTAATCPGGTNTPIYYTSTTNIVFSNSNIPTATIIGALAGSSITANTVPAPGSAPTYITGGTNQNFSVTAGQ